MVLAFMVSGGGIWGDEIMKEAVVPPKGSDVFKERVKYGTRFQVIHPSGNIMYMMSYSPGIKKDGTPSKPYVLEPLFKKNEKGEWSPSSYKNTVRKTRLELVETLTRGGINGPAELKRATQELKELTEAQKARAEERKIRVRLGWEKEEEKQEELIGFSKQRVAFFTALLADDTSAPQKITPPTVTPGAVTSSKKSSGTDKSNAGAGAAR